MLLVIRILKSGRSEQNLQRRLEFKLMNSMVQSGYRRGVDEKYNLAPG
jgi:hypothetical protein